MGAGPNVCGWPRLETDARCLPFVHGRPVSATTTQLLAWCAEPLALEGKSAVLKLGDNASRPMGREAKEWPRRHNQTVEHTGRSVRILVVPAAHQEFLAQPHRAPLGPQQAKRGRARPPAPRLGAG